MSLTYGLLCIVIVFIGLFYYLIQSKKINFRGKKRIIQVEIIFNMVMVLLLIISGGIGFVTCLFLFLLLCSGLFYYVYGAKSEKIGFIGGLFCTFFLFVFLILQFWIYGTSFN